MAKKELTAQQELDLIKDSDELSFIAYKRLLDFFLINSENLSTFDILEDTEISKVYSEEEEKKMAILERRNAMMLKFAEKYANYKDTIENIRQEIMDKVERADVVEKKYRKNTPHSMERLASQ